MKGRNARHRLAIGCLPHAAGIAVFLSGAADDIRLMPDGSWKRRCPSCGDYHLEVRDDELPASIHPADQAPTPLSDSDPVQLAPPYEPESAAPTARENLGREEPVRSEAAAAIAATAALATASVAALGAGLMMLGMGVGPREVFDGLSEWVTQGTPKDSHGGHAAPPPLPSPDARSAEAIFADPRLGEHLTDVAGKEWVYSSRPGDEAGPGWVSAEEHRQTVAQEAQGRVWSDRWGWTHPRGVPGLTKPTWSGSAKPSAWSRKRDGPRMRA